MNLGDYLEDQKADGILQGEGRFTIEAAKARIKQARFQFAHSSHFLLKIFQSLVQTDAETLSWTFDRKRTILQISPSTTIPDFEPASVLKHMTTLEQSAQPVRSLLVGLIAALADEPRHVVWSRRDSGGTQILTLQGNAVAIKESAESGPLLYRFEIERIPRTIFNSVTGVDHALITQRCALAKQQVLLDGLPLHGGLMPARTAAWHKSKSSGFYLYQEFNLNGDGEFKVALPSLDRFEYDSALQLYSRLGKVQDSASTLTWSVNQTSTASINRCDSVFALPLSLSGPDLVITVVNGVTSEPVEICKDGLGATFLIGAEGLTYDVSGLKPVQDEALEKKLAGCKVRIKKAIPRLLEALEQTQVPTLDVQSRRGLLLSLFGQNDTTNAQALTDATLQRLRYLSVSL